ncbi:DUF6351 family protein [uncultured Pseudokineococcus sp.]|uniref:DUF6351 family protein n=1 Tax=uncultured Pseudokineococcus sp. TaxID=1642928 RepID=UPI00260A2D34|nr:DUF6351 family protein [uncultured Pseudokineococcus sp.]
MTAHREHARVGPVLRAVAAPVLALGLVTAPAAAAPAAGSADEPQVRLEVVSSRPDAVTGGEALVRVDLPPGVRPRSLEVRRDGEDVTAEFQRSRSGGLLALIDGLEPGRHVLEASATRAATAHLDVLAHPSTGPVLSGPHEEPFACETEEFRTVAGDRLGAPLDEDCTVATRVDWVYRTTAGQFAPLPSTRRLPADVATTTTLDGADVPYVVRVQTGTANRGVYEIAALDDPRDGRDPSPLRADPGWTGRAVYTLGGGCRGGWYRQGSSTGGVLVDEMLSRGMAVVSSSLNVFGHNCNDLLTSETISLTKEVLVETHGELRYLVGWGCSGGSYQALQAADAYPGLLDGVVVGCTFPEVGQATSQKLADARLLDHYARTTAPGALSGEQLRAVSGFGVLEAVASQSAGAARLDPDAEFDASVPPEARYDAETNPGGARATVWDHARNAYGVDPATGFARRPLDNVGVQYGLGALADGTLTTAQFLDLNERVGGLDVDGRVVPERMRADPAAREAAYRTGRVLDGGAGLAQVPIIDYRAYTDDLPSGDIHMRYHSFSLRERLLEANGDADNLVMLVEDDTYGLFDLRSPLLQESLLAMDEWLLAVAADRSGRDPHDVVVEARPDGLVDACVAPDGRRLEEEQRYREGACDELFPSYASPRIVAGGPLASDVVTCALREPAREEYPAMDDAAWARLQEVFPDGVCDWSSPGAGEVGLDAPWLRFTAPGVWAPLSATGAGR